MVRLLGALFAVFLACGFARAEGVVHALTTPSQALGRPFPYLVYLPAGYERGTHRFPVLYLLHGAGGDETAWMREGGIKETVDRLIAFDLMPPAIVVMPGCKGCWWIDGTSERAETAFWSDLVPEIDRRYRTIASRGGRLVAGLSAGGYGAVRYALRYPDRFVAAAALSPAVYADAPPAHSSARSQPPFLGPDGRFDLARWKAQNYTSIIEGYCRQRQNVAFYLVSGDNDNYGIAFETVTLFKRLYEHQPSLTELRIVDGDHSWAIWSRSIEGAMRYMFAQADRPVPIETPPLVAAAGRNSTAGSDRSAPPQVAARRGAPSFQPGALDP